MSDSILRSESKDLAKDIIILCRGMRNAHVEPALVNQLLRCGTSVGANIREAQYAQGIKDFISKLEISLKECSECEYWLELLHETGSLAEEDYLPIYQKCAGIRRMLISSITTMKAKAEQKQHKE